VIEQIIFYTFGGALLLASAMVILARNPVHAALFLILAFFASSGVWLLLEAEFLAITLVLVYVGAVMVLFLFVVMMLDINLDRLREGFATYLPLALAVGIVMSIAMVGVVGYTNFGPEAVPSPLAAAADSNNTRMLGEMIYTDYLLPFEVAAVLLLVAIVAAIMLTLRPPRERRVLSPGEQVRARRADRVRLVAGGRDAPLGTLDSNAEGANEEPRA